MNEQIQIRERGLNALIAELGRSDADEFLRMMANDRNDYTKWREYLFHGMTVEEISAEAEKLWITSESKSPAS